MRMSVRALTLLLAVLVCAGGTVSATILVPVDLTELVRAADTVAYGRVIDVSAVRVDGRYSDTIVTLASSAVLKGEPRSEVVFRVAGGETGRYRTVILGAPVLREGDEVVVFLAGAAPQIPHLVGFSQGILPILRDDQQRAVVLAPALAVAGAAAQPIVRGQGQRRVLTLAGFADEVRGLLGAAASAQASAARASAPSHAPAYAAAGRSQARR